MFDFNLTFAGAGWADATLTDGDQKRQFAASYLHDALKYFLEAVILVSSEERAMCFWAQEPGMLRWTFERKGNQLKLRAEYPAVCERYPSDCADNADYYTYQDEFFGSTDFRRFLHQVIAAYESIFQEWGPERYLDEWRFPFPSKELEQLSELAVAL